jgi:predicted dehydrogenase
MKKVVVIGTGFIGPVHVEALRRAGVEVAGIVGSSIEKTLAASQRLKLPAVYQTFEQALQDSTVDAIHLTTPNVLHYEQAKAVLAAGKHCLCEKPLAMNSRQSAELMALAKESGLAAGVAYNIRFYPLCHEAAARLRHGGLGRLFHVTGSYVQDWLLHDTDFNWRVLAEDGGELRSVADIGTHWLDLVQFIIGQHVISVCADLKTVHPTRYRPLGGVETFSNIGPDKTQLQPIAISTEDCGAVLLKFSDGASGSLFVSQVTAGRKNCLRWELAGSQSAMEWNSESPS